MIEAPPPGRELDALVAEHVLHYSRRTDPGLGPGWRNDETSTFFRDSHDALPAFSQWIGDAWEILEMFRAEGKSWIVQTDPYGDGEYEVTNQTDEALPLKGWDFEDEAISCTSKSAPHAICLAALKAKGKL